MTEPSEFTLASVMPGSARRRRWLLPVLAVAVVLALAGAAALFFWPTTAGPAPRVADVAARIGCSTSKLYPTTELYARESGSCGIAARTYRITVFADNDLRDQWLQVASQFGGSRVVGDRYAVSVDGVDEANRLAGVLGGTVR